MFKVLSVGLMCFMFAFSASAANISKTPTENDVIEDFCKYAGIDIDEQDCINMLSDNIAYFEQLMKRLKAVKLKSLGKQLESLSKQGTKNSKNLKSAVDNIGNTLRSPIKIPDGVRNMPNAPAQQFIQQQIPLKLAQ